MEKKMTFRLSIILILIALIFLVLVYKLLQMQVVQGKYYKELSEKHLVQAMPLKAPRGEIFDKYGRPLVSNKMGFSIFFHKINQTDEQLNSTILNLISVMTQEGQKYNDSLPISSVPFNFAFDIISDKSLASQEFDWKKGRGFVNTITAENVIKFYRKRYKLRDDINDINARLIIGVRYEMESRFFSISSPFTFASDVNIKIVTKVKEQGADFPGEIGRAHV